MYFRVDCDDIEHRQRLGTGSVDKLVDFIEEIESMHLNHVRLELSSSNISILVTTNAPLNPPFDTLAQTTLQNCDIKVLQNLLKPKIPIHIVLRSRELTRKEKCHRATELKLKIIEINLTATTLDWRNSVTIQTDSVSWNRFMRLTNGNGPKKLNDYIDCMYQNLPGVLGVTTLGAQIGSIVSRLNPDVLFIGEANSEDVKSACPDGYNWIGGSLKDKDD